MRGIMKGLYYPTLNDCHESLSHKSGSRGYRYHNEELMLKPHQPSVMYFRDSDQVTIIRCKS